MKYVRILFCTLCSFYAVSLHAESFDNDATREIDEIALEQAHNPKPQIILNGIANIVAHIGSIVGNPHNRPNVGHNVTGILGNIISIALAASQRGYKTEDELWIYLIDELHLDQELRRIIEHEAEEIDRKRACIE